jgi:hypothetical protein
MTRRGSAAQAVLVQMPDAREPETEPKSEDQRAADDQIAESTSQAPSLAQAKIERVNNRGGKEYLGTVAPDLVTNEFLAKECGGGEYIVEYRKPAKKGSSTEYAERRRFYIADNIPRKVPSWFQDSTSDVTPPPAVTNGHGGSMFETMALHMMTQQMQAQQAALQMQQSQMTAAMESSRQQMQMQLEMMRQQGEASRAAAEQQSRMTQAFMESMRLSFTNQPKLTDTLTPFVPIVLEMLKNRADPMEIATRLGTLLKPSNDPSTIAGMLTAVEKVISIGKGMTPDSGEPAGWMDLVKEGLHAVPAVVANMRNGQPAPVHPNPNGGQPVAALPAPSAPAVPPPLPEKAAPSPDAMLQQALRPVATEIFQLAQQNADPELQAEGFYDRYRGLHGAMLSFTSEPDYQGRLLNLFPDLRQYEGWVRRFMSELSALLHEPVEP